MSYFRGLFRRPIVGDNSANSVQDEQDLTNFRVLTDYVTSLLVSWVRNSEIWVWLRSLPIRRRKD